MVVDTVACPSCLAPVGKDCVKMTSRGPSGKPTKKPLTTPDGMRKVNHASRQRLVPQ